MNIIEKKYREFEFEKLGFSSSASASALIFSIALAVSFVVNEKEGYAQDVSSENVVLNSASIYLKTDNGYFGQGYLVLEDGNVRIYTIKHVISDAISYVYVSVPNFKNKAKVGLSSFVCEEEAGQIVEDTLDADSPSVVEGALNADSACYYQFTEESNTKLLSSDSHKPFIRLREHEELKIGAYISFPKQKGSAFSLMKIVDIDDIYITVEAVQEVSSDGIDLIHGTICNGRSGGPAILVSLINNNTSLLRPISQNGSYVVVGEIEMGLGGDGFDDPDTGVDCFIKGKIRRPIK